jgi:GH24 family phage-related lysozyme (muramidase)
MEETIIHFEGSPEKHTKVYLDTKGIKTVGVGFNMQQRNARKTFEKYIPNSEVSFKDVFSGKKEITPKQARNLFKGTLADKVKTTKNLFPQYDNYPKAVKTALVNGVFRGEFKSSQNTVKHINSGQWDKVAKEYLDRRDYRNSKPGHNYGIKKRMDFNAAIFREYAKEIKKG